MAADPNWLYSSTVQATGALIAILGGFLASTLLVQIAERERLFTRRREKRGELATLQRRHNELYVSAQARRLQGAIPSETHQPLAEVEKDIALGTEALRYLDWQIKAAAGVPKHARDAWKFLAAAAILGIGPGLILMPQEPADYRQWQKALVIVSFAIALVVLGVFIARLFAVLSATESG